MDHGMGLPEVIGHKDGGISSNSLSLFPTSCHLEAGVMPLPWFPEHPLSFISCNMSHSGPRVFGLEFGGNSGNKSS